MVSVPRSSFVVDCEAVASVELVEPPEVMRGKKDGSIAL